MSSLILSPDQLQPDPAGPAGPGAWVVPSDPRSAAVRLQVYSGGYPARISESLQESFPAVTRIIGHQGLTSLTERYIRRSALRSYNLNHAGAALPTFLSTDPLAATFPFLPDLAKLEWQMAKAFHARQRRPVTPASFAHWHVDEWARAVFRFQPAVAVLVSSWPVRRIWAAAQRGGRPVDAGARAQRSYVLVRRTGFAVRCDSMTAGEAHALAALLEGRALGEVTETLAPRSRPADVSRWFARWMAAGLITHCSVGPS